MKAKSLEPQFLVVGRVKDAHGLKGEIFVRLKAGRADWLESFAEFKLRKASGIERVLKPAKVRVHKDGLICHPEGFLDRTEAEGWKGAEVLIPESYIQSEPGEAPFLGEFLGARILTPQGQPLGEVVALKTNGAQDLLEVSTSRGLGLVPLVPEFVVEMDLAKKVLVMDLPEGLLP